MEAHDNVAAKWLSLTIAPAGAISETQTFGSVCRSAMVAAGELLVDCMESTLVDGRRSQLICAKCVRTRCRCEELPVMMDPAEACDL